MSLGESNPATLIFESALILAMSLMVATAHGQSASRKGAKRGAAIGAVAGGATQAYRKNDRYKRVYDDCMAGYRVEHY